MISKFIEYEDFKLQYNKEILNYKVVAELYESDKGNEDLFKLHLKLAHLMYYPLSTYRTTADEEERLAEILHDEELSNFRKSSSFKKFLAFYKERISKELSSANVLTKAQAVLDKLERYLDEIDWNATDENGRLIYDLTKTMTAMKQIPEVTKMYNKALSDCYQEMVTESTAKGKDNKKGETEDGFDDIEEDE